MTEDGVFVRVKSFPVWLPDIATVTLESGWLTCTLKLFGVVIWQPLRYRIEDISSVCVSKVQGFIRLEVLNRSHDSMITFEPHDVSKWREELKACGVKISDIPGAGLNKISTYLFRSFSWLVLIPVVVVLVLVAVAYLTRILR